MSFIEEGSLIALTRYKAMLEGKGVKPENCALDDNKDETSLPHLLWMVNELMKNIKPGTGTGYSVDKFSRWIGFIQYGLVAHKLTKVKIERNITRPLFTKSEEKAEAQVS